MEETHIRGSVIRITFRNEDNGYTIAKIQAQGIGTKEITIIGNFPSIDVGEIGDIHGEWVNDPQYGRQFSASRIDFIVPTTVKSIENLLAKGKFRGIGKKYAKMIVNKFGNSAINIIENEPDRLKEISGIGEKKVQEIVRSWNKKKSLKHINLFLAEHELPLSLAEKIFAKYRENALFILKNRTHKLAEDIRGIGFRKADDIALKIGIEPTSSDRIKAALIYILKQASGDGHVFLPHDELFQQGNEYLQLDHELISSGIEDLSKENKIYVEGEKVFLRFLYAIENIIVSRINKIHNTPSLQLKEFDVQEEIGKIERTTGIAYSERQKKALSHATKHKIIVITGGPGTGKTMSIKALVQLFMKSSATIRLAAPTGRAAKRMEETCHIPAQTIHRLLDYDPTHGMFSRNYRSPLKADVVIIDELSMIDAPLMAALLSAIHDTTRLILVGDADQLPSVGPGNILKDILDSGIVASIQLDLIFRQGESSDIIAAAHKINSGEVPYIDNSKNKNLFFIVEKEPDLIPDKVSDLIKRRLPEKYGYDPIKDVQVLTSMYKGATGANNLNSLLQKMLIPGGKFLKRGDRTYLVGDKVMQIRNNYTKEVYNGDIGYVTDINTDNSELTIRYDSRDVMYVLKDLDQIVHAYAITVHKSQGSEYKAVVMPITTQHYIMLQKNLIYTAVTRAKELMIFIGTYKAFNIAVKNNKTSKRYTNLTERLCNPDKNDKQLNLLYTVSDSLRDWF
jgi:exodeoxyribonuclease V alpha subunit